MAYPASSNSTWWLEPTPLVLIFSVVLAITVPLFLHLFIFRSSSSSTLPTFLLVGPSGGGKTSLQTLIERHPSTAARTTTSQTPLTVEAHIPVTLTPTIASNKYRSAHDPSAASHAKFLMTDTPGHGKLRHHALTILRTPKSHHIRGVIYTVDGTALAPESAALRDAAEYLHDVLLALQGVSAKEAGELEVLVLVNKMDLFTALPADMAGRALEEEIGKIRVSRGKGLMEAGSKEGDVGTGAEDTWLGAGGEGAFTFGQMEDAGVRVKVIGSQLEGAADGTNAEKVWNWLGEQL